jgi:hypothetical protein
LKLKLDNTLDYEVLPAEKTFPITISSVASISGILAKQFLIEILGKIYTYACILNAHSHSVSGGSI